MVLCVCYRFWVCFHPPPLVCGREGGEIRASLLSGKISIFIEGLSRNWVFLGPREASEEINAKITILYITPPLFDTFRMPSEDTNIWDEPSAWDNPQVNWILYPPPFYPLLFEAFNTPMLEWWDAVLQMRLPWTLFFCVVVINHRVLSTNRDWFWAFINFPTSPPP